MGFQSDAFQTDPLAFQMEGAAVTRYGKYKPEHDSALVDLGAAEGFASEHASALRDLFDAGI